MRALGLMLVRLRPVFTFSVSQPDLTMSFAGVAAVYHSAIGSLASTCEIRPRTRHCRVAMHFAVRIEKFTEETHMKCQECGRSRN